jgi:uncharacterized protein (DUF2225 family)
MAIDVSEVKRRLFLLLNDANLVNDYIRQYGPKIDIKYIKTVKDAKAKACRDEGSGQGQDPIYIVEVSCPVCGREKIECYELRAKSQQILQNKFLVPVFSGAFGYRTTDYTLLAVAVCPRCLFASPDKKDFNRPVPGVAGSTAKSQLISNVIMTLQEKIGERKALLKSVSDYENYFKRPRTDDAAMLSYRLAVLRAGVEAWYEQPYSCYKLGAYSLRIAKIIKDRGGQNREVLKEAVGHFEEAFRASNCPSEEIEMQVIYTIVALFLKLGDQRKANSYIGVFSNLKNNRLAEMKKNPALNTIAIEKWENKAKGLWEDRENEKLFKEE